MRGITVLRGRAIESNEVAALGYFIFPADAIPDITPVVGYADDLGVLAAALAAIAAHVTPEAKRRASEQLKILFGE